MSFERLSAWFLTSAGRKFVYLGTGAASTGALCLNVLPHTIFLDKYRDFVHLYKKGFTVPLSQKLQDRFQKALDLVEIDERDKPLFKPFAATGFDIFSAGSSYSHYGVIVGIPANFAYDTVNDVDKLQIKIRHDSVTWETEDGQRLEKSLVLSEKAQIYAMAREIQFRQTLKTFIDATISIITITGTYGITSAINMKLNLFARPRIMRIVMYCLVYLFSYGTYTLGKDSSQVYYEHKIDQELKKKDPIFVEGGKEFYTKILERNKALRKLLGKEGERAYTHLGNENYLVRYKHMPLVQRKALFEESV